MSLFHVQHYGVIMVFQAIDQKYQVPLSKIPPYFLAMRQSSFPIALDGDDVCPVHTVHCSTYIGILAYELSPANYLSGHGMRVLGLEP